MRSYKNKSDKHSQEEELDVLLVPESGCLAMLEDKKQLQNAKHKNANQTILLVPNTLVEGAA